MEVSSIGNKNPSRRSCLRNQTDIQNTLKPSEKNRTHTHTFPSHAVPFPHLCWVPRRSSCSCLLEYGSREPRMRHVSQELRTLISPLSQGALRRRAFTSLLGCLEHYKWIRTCPKKADVRHPDSLRGSLARKTRNRATRFTSLQLPSLNYQTCLVNQRNTLQSVSWRKMLVLKVPKQALDPKN